MLGHSPNSNHFLGHFPLSEKMNARATKGTKSHPLFSMFRHQLESVIRFSLSECKDGKEGVGEEISLPLPKHAQKCPCLNVPSGLEVLEGTLSSTVALPSPPPRLPRKTTKQLKSLSLQVFMLQEEKRVIFLSFHGIPALLYPSSSFTHSLSIKIVYWSHTI